jgi:hypothetical protein
MKKHLLFLLFILLTTNFIIAQPQWKFHIAFEDATGAKDTIWLIWDTTATFGIDTQFNEQAQPINYSVFNVFTGNVNGDTTKTQALPHPHASNNVEVHAINYQYPITISWDSSLFHAPGLPPPVGYVNNAWIGNNYFFIVNNCPPCQHFNMLIDNQAFAPAFWWGSQSQFPMSFVIMRDITIGIDELVIATDKINIVPNPTTDAFTINSTYEIIEFLMLSSDGRIVLKSAASVKPVNSVTVQVASIKPGLYQLIYTNIKNQTYHEKIIVNH